MSDTGKIIALAKAVGASPDPAVIQQDVEDWLDDHPEATTTVQDGTITRAKLAAALEGDIAAVEATVGSHDTYTDITPSLTISSPLGYYNVSTKVFTENSTYMVTEPTECGEGDVFVIPHMIMKGYAAASLITFDSGMNVLTCANQSTSGNELRYTCTASDKYIVFGTMSGRLLHVLKKTGSETLTDAVSGNRQDIDSIEKTVYEDGAIDYSGLAAYAGYIQADGTPASYAHGKCATIGCAAGDKFMFTGEVTGQMKYWYILDDNGNVLSSETYTQPAVNRTVTVSDPAAKRIAFSFNVYNGRTFSLYKLVPDKTKSRIGMFADAVNENRQDIDIILPDIFEDGTAVDHTEDVDYAGYIGANGTKVDYANARCAALDCAAGDKYRFTGEVTGVMKYWYILDGSGNVLGSDAYTGPAVNRAVTVLDPAAKKIAFSFYIGGGATFSLYKIASDKTKYKSERKPYTGKTWFAFGDSITFGVNGGYTTYVTDRCGAAVDNYGHSGDTIANGLYVVTNGAFGTANSQTKLCSDYSGAAIATIMLGTNSGIPADWETSFNALPALEYGKRLGTLPFTKGGVTIADAAAYYALFPDDAVGKYAFMLEWMMWKNPDMKIFMITPPPRKSSTTDHIAIRRMLMALSERYGVPLIDCVSSCMINDQNFDEYSADETHFTTKGNEVWGRYIGDYIKRYGEIYA